MFTSVWGFVLGEASRVFRNVKDGFDLFVCSCVRARFSFLTGPTQTMLSIFEGMHGAAERTEKC